jgi:hypothetical protein
MKLETPFPTRTDHALTHNGFCIMPHLFRARMIPPLPRRANHLAENFALAAYPETSTSFKKAEEAFQSPALEKPILALSCTGKGVAGGNR